VNKINLFLLISSSVLVACNQHKREPFLDVEPSVEAPLPPHAPTEPLAFNQSEKSILSPKEESSLEIAIPEKAQLDQLTEWHPKEGDLVRAGELIMKLKKETESNLTNEKMVSYLENNMSISSSQAHLILEELGLE